MEGGRAATDPVDRKVVVAADVEEKPDAEVGCGKKPREEVPGASGVKPSPSDVVLVKSMEEKDPVAKKMKVDRYWEDYDANDEANDEEYEYFSGDKVTEGNVQSLKEKEEEKIRIRGVRYYYNNRFKKFQCPYCKTKDKPKSGFFEHMLSHARNASHSNDESFDSRAKHATLLAVLTPVP